MIECLLTQVHWFYRPNFIPVKVDECLQKLRESLNQTMRNVVYDDNRNIGRLSEKLYILGLNVDKGFENFALDYIGYMTIEEIRTYTAGFVKLIEEQRERLKNVYDPRNITQENRSLFETLYTTIEITLHGELGPFRTVINKKPNAKHCWDYGKSVICKIITGISTEIDRILQLEARVNQHKFEKLLKSVGDMREILPAAYEKCLVRRLEDRPEERKKCAAFHVSELLLTCLLNVYCFLFTILDEGEEQIIFVSDLKRFDTDPRLFSRKKQRGIDEGH